MQTQCDISLIAGYKSRSQQARVISEGWLSSYGYCLNCDSNKLQATRANTKARDFLCPRCYHPYELKSKSRTHGGIVQDGAFESMMERIRASEAPSLFLLAYDESWRVTNLHAIHSLFLTANVVLKRNPLSLSAQRKEWVGCNIAVKFIPPEGRIPLIINGCAVSPVIARTQFRRGNSLGELKPAQRGWTALTLALLRLLNRREFTLADAYQLESQFAQHYPSNRHIRAKIRQQLQILRDLKYLEFLGSGRYRIVQAAGSA